MSRNPRIRPLREHEVGRTLVDDLVPVADDLRQLYTEFGARAYRVFLVWVKWTADEDGDGRVMGAEAQLEDGAEGVGRAALLREVELLPTPRVSAMSGNRRVALATALGEIGGLFVDQISPSYPEDVLMGLIPEARDPKAPESIVEGVSFFWEIREMRRAGQVYPGTASQDVRPDKRPYRARFNAVSRPNRNTTRFQWEVELSRADGERGRNGEMEDVG